MEVHKFKADLAREANGFCEQSATNLEEQFQYMIEDILEALNSQPTPELASRMQSISKLMTPASRSTSRDSNEDHGFGIILVTKKLSYSGEKKEVTMAITHTVTHTGKDGVSPLLAFAVSFRNDVMLDWDVEDVINVIESTWDNGVSRRGYVIRVDMDNQRLFISGDYETTTGFPSVAALHMGLINTPVIELLSDVSTIKNLGVAPGMGKDFIKIRLLVELRRAVDEYLTKGGL